jgi:hypothetical protein
VYHWLTFSANPPCGLRVGLVRGSVSSYTGSSLGCSVHIHNIITILIIKYRDSLENIAVVHVHVFGDSLQTWRLSNGQDSMGSK